MALDGREGGIMNDIQKVLYYKIIDSVFFRQPYLPYMTEILVVKLCMITDPECTAFDAVCVAEYLKQKGVIH